MFYFIKNIFRLIFLMFFVSEMEIFACFSAKNLVSLQRKKTSRKHGFYSQKGWHFRVVTMALSRRKSMVFIP